MTSPVRVRRMRRSHWVLVGVLLVLAGLSAWGVRARVPVYAVAAHTPLALDPALQVVVTPVAGQVRVTHLQVGREVQAWEVLVELDSTAQRLQLEEAQQHLRALARLSGNLPPSGLKGITRSLKAQDLDIRPLPKKCIH